jgi:hypothetical protein
MKSIKGTDENQFLFLYNENHTIVAWFKKVNRLEKREKDWERGRECCNRLPEEGF